MPSLPNIRIRQAFACPIADTMLPDTADLNRRLREQFLIWEADIKRKRSSLPTPVVKVGVYESDFHLFTSDHPDIKLLANMCLNHLGYLVAQLNDYKQNEMEQLRIYHHSWYHITRNGGYTAAHNHPMASWSGVYCVDPGDNASEMHNNGTLRFLDARTSANSYIDMGNAYLPEPYIIAELAYELQPGRLLMFPSYMVHEVSPYFGQRERITVAFNAWIRDQHEPIVEPSIKLRRR
jgi:uncharacterized protein (TIGR02466 family)